MNVLDFNVTPDSLVYWLMTLTLLHVSWIGLVIGLIATTGNCVLRNRSASIRYWLNSVSLLAFAASLPLTFAVVRNMSADDGGDVPKAVMMSVPAPQHGALLPTAPADAMPFTPDQPADSFNSDRSVRSDKSDQSVGSGQAPIAVWAKCQHVAKAASPFVSAWYFIGVALMLIKLAIGVRISRSLRAASQPISDADVLTRMAIQAKKLSLRIVPVIAYCEHVAVPIVIGLLRPMILVPAAMVNGLTTEQLESVLTHELAHLRRHDHLVIVMQRVLEAVLFFHPVTWYLSRRIHDEREICCDDLVLAIGGDRLQYAQSLLRVAELRLAAGSRNDKSLTALAADGQRPSKLRQRIARLLGDSKSDSVRLSSVWIVAVLVAFVTTSGWVINTMATPAVAEIAGEVARDFESIESLVEQAPVQQCLVPANAFAVDRSEAETTNVKPLIANIDKDHTLELVAVVSLDDRTKAWSPDGTRIEPQPTWPVPIQGRPQEHRTHGFIFRGTGWKDETAIAWRAPGPNVTPGRSDTVPESIGLTGTFTDLKTVNVRAGLTTPDWGPWVSVGLDDTVTPYETSPEFSELYARIKPDTLAISKGYALVLHGVNGVDERAVHEEVAVWKDGTIHIRRGHGLTKDIDVISFFEGTDLVDHLEYRLRPYVHWVTFENVSLAQGVKSEAKVSVQTLELPKKAAQKLQGHVRDADGKPIAEANVAVRTTSVGIPKTMQAKTDSDGRFELLFSSDAWPKHIPLVLWAWAPGYAVNVETQFASKDDLETPVNITLTIPDKVRFRVTDPKGNGVAGVVVTPSHIAIQMPNASARTELIDTVPEFLSRTSDAEGIVEMDSLQGASLHSLSIQSVDYGRQCFDVQHSTSLIDTNGVIRLRLQPTTQVRGRLVGAPAQFLKGIQVDLRTDVKDWPYGRVEGFATAVTDDQGRFEVAAIASGELTIWQRPDSNAKWRLVPNRHKHTLISGTSPEIEFVLKETVEVPFKIIREDSGLPVAGVGVFITDETGFFEISTGTSDERGEFRARVFEDTWNVATVDRVPAKFTPPTDDNDFAWFPESPVRFRSPLAAGFDVPVVPIDVPKGRLLRGQLVDPDNKPLARWTVITQSSGGETDADGKFSIILRHNQFPSDWKTYSPENSRGVAKVISESPLVLQVTDYSRAVLPPGPEMYTPRGQE